MSGEGTSAATSSTTADGATDTTTGGGPASVPLRPSLSAAESATGQGHSSGLIDTDAGRTAPPTLEATSATTTTAPAVATGETAGPTTASPVLESTSPTGAENSPKAAAAAATASSTAKKFSSLNVNRRFLEKASSPVTPPRAAVSSPVAPAGRLSTSSPHSRLVTSKVSTGTTSAPAGWARPGPSSTAAPTQPAHGVANVSSPSPNASPALGAANAAPRLTSMASGHSSRTSSPVAGAAGAGGAGPRASPGPLSQLASKVRTASPSRSAWGVVKAPTTTTVVPSKDFPTAAEAAKGKREKEEREKREAAEAAAQQQALLRGLDRFRGTGLDKNASHWDEMEDEDSGFLDEVVEFGDGTQYKIPHHEENEHMEEPLPPPADESRGPPVSKEDRFVDDFDRSWPRSGHPRPDGPAAEAGSKESRVAAPDGDVLPPPRASREPPPHAPGPRALFNERSNRLEPNNGRVSESPANVWNRRPAPGLGQVPGSDFRGRDPPPHPSFHLLRRPSGVHDAPPHLTSVGQPPEAVPSPASSAAPRRLSDARPNEAGPRPQGRLLQFRHDEPPHKAGTPQSDPAVGARTFPMAEPARSSGDWRAARERDREPPAPVGEPQRPLPVAGPGAIADGPRSESQPADGPSRPPPPAVGGLKSFLSPIAAQQSLPQQLPPSDGTNRPGPGSGSGSGPSATGPFPPPDKEEFEKMQANEMHSAAERARMRRQKEEEEREAQKERARKKALELEEKAKALAAGAKAAAETQPKEPAKAPVPAKAAEEPGAGAAAAPPATSPSVRSASVANQAAGQARQEAWRPKNDRGSEAVLPPRDVGRPRESDLPRSGAAAFQPSQRLSPSFQRDEAHRKEIPTPRTGSTGPSTPIPPPPSTGPSSSSRDEEHLSWRRAAAPVVASPSSKKTPRETPPHVLTRAETTVPVDPSTRPGPGEGKATAQTVSQTPDLGLRSSPPTEKPPTSPLTSPKVSLFARVGGPSKAPMIDSKEGFKLCEMSVLDDVMTRIKGAIAEGGRAREAATVTTAQKAKVPQLTKASDVAGPDTPTTTTLDGQVSSKSGRKARIADPPISPSVPARPVQPSRMIIISPADFNMSRPELPHSPRPWKTYTVKINKLALNKPRPRISARQRALYNVPVWPVQFLSWDPPSDLSKRTLQRDDMFFKKRFNRGIVISPVNLPKKRIQPFSTQNLRQNQPSTAAKTTTTNGGTVRTISTTDSGSRTSPSAPATTVSPTLNIPRRGPERGAPLPGLLGRSRARLRAPEEGSWRRMDSLPPSPHKAASDERETATTVVTAEGTSSDTPKVRLPSTSQANGNLKGSTTAMSPSAASDGEYKQGDGSSTLSPSTGTMKSRSRLRTGEAFGFSRDVGVKAQSINATTTDAATFMVSSEIESSVVDGQGSGLQPEAADGSKSLTSSSSREAGSSVDVLSKGSGVTSEKVSPAAKEPVVSSTLASSTWGQSPLFPVLESSSQNAPDRDHIKNVWSQPADTRVTKVENSLRGIADDFPSAIPSSLNDLKSEDIDQGTETAKADGLGDRFTLPRSTSVSGNNLISPHVNSASTGMSGPPYSSQSILSQQHAAPGGPSTNSSGAHGHPHRSFYPAHSTAQHQQGFLSPASRTLPFSTAPHAPAFTTARPPSLMTQSSAPRPFSAYSPLHTQQPVTASQPYDYSSASAPMQISAGLWVPPSPVGPYNRPLATATGGSPVVGPMQQAPSIAFSASAAGAPPYHRPGAHGSGKPPVTNAFKAAIHPSARPPRGVPPGAASGGYGHDPSAARQMGPGPLDSPLVPRPGPGMTQYGTAAPYGVTPVAYPHHHAYQTPVGVGAYQPQQHLPPPSQYGPGPVPGGAVQAPVGMMAPQSGYGGGFGRAGLPPPAGNRSLW